MRKTPRPTVANVTKHLALDPFLGLFQLKALNCFCTVVLEKILESPLDCKEIQPVHPKENQS